MKVCKFGGTSMSCGDAVKRVQNIIRADEQRRYIVVSAPGKRGAGDEKVTDMLIAIASTHGKEFDLGFAKVKSRYMEIAASLGVESFEDVLDDTARQIKELNDFCYTVSRGEYLMAKLLAKKLDIPFVDTEKLVRFARGSLLFDDTIRNLQNALSSVHMAVLPGFYGSDENGRIVTFSRGGSDITGSLVAASLHADAYENWTDVDGVYSKDPRKDKSAVLFEKLSYKDMYDLALGGANVLHKDAVYPVERAGIPLNIKNTFNPSCKGTLVT